MSAAATTENDLTILLAQRWEQSSQKIADLAAAIPGNRFEEQPVAGLRTCGAVLRHLVFWNRYVADSIAGKAADDAGNEVSATEYATKQSLLDGLKRSSAEVAAALRNHPRPLSTGTTELVMSFVEHTSEHYGQLAVYARVMGIVPPASRT